MSVLTLIYDDENLLELGYALERFYMHNNFIAHRDLKPENFLLANEKDVTQAPLKIIDFGLSRRFASQDGCTA